jgi:hypothetical protein
LRLKFETESLYFDRLWFGFWRRLFQRSDVQITTWLDAAGIITVVPPQVLTGVRVLLKAPYSKRALYASSSSSLDTVFTVTLRN